MSVTNLDNKPIFPWENLLAFVPAGFSLTKEGLFFENNRGSDDLVSGPVWISETTKSRTHTEWGRVISFLDYDGDCQQIAVVDSRISDRSTNLYSELHDLGLHVIPGRQNLLLRYLASFKLTREYRRESVSKVGWLDSREDEAPVYVTPQRTYGLPVTTNIVFQPEEHSPTLLTMRAKKQLYQWREFVAAPCKDHPMMVFALCTAFSGPLLKLVGQDCGGFHFYGTSSKGKTTLLQVSGTVWGSGADPAASDYSYIGRWNTTGNALEAVAAAHNDGLLCLDEMGTCDQRDFGKVIYDLFGGQGKRRLNKKSMLQRSRTWRLAALSTGEISVEDKILEGGGKHRTGHLVRMIDVPIGEGVFLGEPDQSRLLVNNLKKHCSNFYGTAGPAFVDQLTRYQPTFQEMKLGIQSLVEDIEANFVKTNGLEPFQERVLRRMCVVAAAGSLACDFEVLPFDKLTVMNSLLNIWNLWLQEGSSKPPVIVAILRLKEFILCNQSRFVKLGEEDAVVRDQAGYHSGIGGKRHYLLTDSAAREALQGHNVKTVMRELAQRKFLHTTEVRRLKSKHTIRGTRQYFYTINETFLEFEG